MAQNPELKNIVKMGPKSIKKASRVDAIHVMEKTAEELMVALKITRKEAMEYIHDHGVADMLHEVTDPTQQNRDRQVTWDIMERGVNKAMEMHIATFFKRMKMLKNAELMDAIGKRNKWVDGELGKKCNKLSRKELLAFSGPMFNGFARDINRRFEELSKFDEAQLKEDGEKFKGMIMETMPGMYERRMYVNQIDPI